MEPTTRTSIKLLVLSVLVTLLSTRSHSGLFLGFCGMLLGGLSLGDAMRRSPDLIAMLAFVTSVSALTYVFSLLPFAIFLLTVSPSRVCGVSKNVIARAEHPQQPLVQPASGQALVSLGYPWNMTETAQGHQDAVSAAYFMPSSVVAYAKQVSAVMCGPSAESFLLFIGLLVVAFAFLVVMPLAFLSLRLLRTAREAGGCDGCVQEPPRAVFVRVPASAINGGARPGPSRGYSAVRDPKVPLAQGQPVTHPTSVRVVPNEMH